MKIKNILLTSLLALTSVVITKNAASEGKTSIIRNANDTYYTNVDTSSGSNLIDSLEDIISRGTNDVGYNGLWEAYKKTDVRPGTNIIWDMYSNENYDADNDHNGNYSKEGDMFNREHSIPQSWFSEKSPMKADLFHVYPTDGYVNNRRSNYPFGEVSNPTYTSKNGSKVGHSSFTGYSGTVFEPIDEYKGDFARTYFYMATRYKSQVGSWGSGANVVFKGSYPYLTDYALNLFTKWSHEDPVSEKEINRNEAVYGIQHNRNPYIDHPEYIDLVFPNEYTDAPVTPADEYKIILDANGGTFASSVTTSYNVKNGEMKTITLPTEDLVSAPSGSTLKGFTDGTNNYEPGQEITISSKVIIRAVYEVNVLSVAQAINICNNTGTTATSVAYTVRGRVSSITEVSEQFKNATFVITDGTNNLTIFRASINTEYTLHVGDMVEVTGPLVNYNDTTPEMTKNGDLRVTYKLSTGVSEELYHFEADVDYALNIRYNNLEVISLDANLLVNNSNQNTKYYVILTSLNDAEIENQYYGEKTFDDFSSSLGSKIIYHVEASNQIISYSLEKNTNIYMYVIAQTDTDIKISASTKLNAYELYQANYNLYSDVQQQIINKYFA